MFFNLILIVSLINCINAKIAILVLGSHIHDILNDRINVALNEADKFNNEEIVWYLSGGIKYTFDELCQRSEAEQMSNLILKKNKNWEILEDTRAKNTAENFAYFNKWLENQNENIKIFVSTSDFHKNRASIMSSKIINKEINWIIGLKECSFCWNDEKYHIKNINSDIKLALNI